MVGDKWLIRWHEYLTDSYAYGTEIEFNMDNTVSYKNRLMPPGTILHVWHSKTNFQMQRLEPMLPLIDGEAYYRVLLNADYPSDNNSGLMLRIVFKGRYDEVVDSLILRDSFTYFKPPINMYSYDIELIYGGASEFIFKSLILKEVSKEEYEQDQSRIDQIKEISNKNKKRRGKNQKAK